MEKPSKEQLDEAIAREKENVAREVEEQEKDLEEAVGGTQGGGAGDSAGTPASPGTFEPAWKISYET